MAGRMRAVAMVPVSILLLAAFAAPAAAQSDALRDAPASPSPDEQSCIDANPNDPWYPTIAAFEVYDSGRTHDYACAHFGGSMTGPNDVFAYVSPDTLRDAVRHGGDGP